MSTRSTIRRMALVCAGALAIVPLTAGAAAAQSAEDLCEQAPGDPITEALCDALTDDNGDENGDDEGPLDALDPEELCALQDEAPEELAPLLDALAPLIDAICEAEEEEEPEEPVEPVEPEDDPEELPETEEPDDTTDADPSGELPRTGGLAGLAGLGLLGAGIALRRLRSGGGLT